MKPLEQIKQDNITAVIATHIKENPKNKPKIDQILSLNVVFNPNFANLYHQYEQTAIKELKSLGLPFEAEDKLEEWKKAYQKL